MQILTILQEALYFFTRQWRLLLVVTLPWLVIETAAQVWLAEAMQHMDPKAPEVTWEHMAAVLVIALLWSYINACLIVFLHERSEHERLSVSSIWQISLRYVPFILLAAALIGTAIVLLSAPAIQLGFLPLLVIPGWLVIRLAFVNFYIVIEHLTPMQAVHASYHFTRGRFLDTTLVILLFFFTYPDF